MSKDDKILFIEGLASAIVKDKGVKELENIVWDITFGEIMGMQWSDVVMLAEDYCVPIPVILNH